MNVANATKDALLRAGLETLRIDGLAGTSSRGIANRAGVNQALVFYHFGGVSQLLDEACRLAVDQSADFYAGQFAAVSSLAELLSLGRELHTRERDLGNVAVMAQLMSGAQRDDVLAATARYAMGRWNSEIETVVRRVMRGSALADLADPAGLARAISAGFIGLELYEGVDPTGAASALEVLATLGVVADIVDDLGPVARRAVKAKMRPAKRPRA